MEKTISLADVLAAQRLLYGWSLAALAKDAGISESEVSRIERGQRVPGPVAWWRLAQAAGIDSMKAVDVYLVAETRCHTLVRFADHLLDLGKVAEAKVVGRRLWTLNRVHYGGRYNADIYRLLGRTAYLNNTYRVAVRWFRAMHGSAKRGGTSPQRRALAEYNYGLALKKRAHVVESAHHLHSALPQLLDTGQLRLASWCALALANLSFVHSAFHDADRYYMKSLEWFDDGDPLRSEAQLGHLECQVALNPEQIGVDREIQRAVANADPDMQRRLTHVLAVLYRKRGQFWEAIAALEEAYPISAYPLDLEALDSYAERVLCHLLAGDVGGAQKALEVVHPYVAQATAEDQGMLYTVAVLLGKVLGEGPSLAEGYSARWETLLGWAGSPDGVALLRHARPTSK